MVASEPTRASCSGAVEPVMPPANTAPILRLPGTES